MDRQIELDRQAEIEKQARLTGLLQSAQTALFNNKLTTPVDDSAYHYYQRVLELDPQNSQATAGISLIADRYLALARRAFDRGQDRKAEQYVKLGIQIKNDHPELLAFDHRLTHQDRSVGGSVDRVFRRVIGYIQLTWFESRTACNGSALASSV